MLRKALNNRTDGPSSQAGSKLHGFLKTYMGERRSSNARLGDFTMDARVYAISALAIPIGAIAAISALILLRLIAFFTNCFYFGRFSTAANPPANHLLGWLALFVPVLGGLIVGFMARYGSERIRGHGIPEAIESILLDRSRIEPKIALLKPPLCRDLDWVWRTIWS
jgi:chloride channel protein, CIC family